MEIKCPHCNQIFNLSEDDSEAIITQIRTKEFDQEIEKRLHNALELSEAQTQLKVMRAVDAEKDKTRRLQSQIDILQSNMSLMEHEHELAVQQTRIDVKNECESKYSELQLQLQAKEHEVEYYKDLKVRMSTKMVGETLEQHCMFEFEKLRATAFRNAYFAKDNQVSKSGSKGDFIYRDYEHDTEFISIMFEMKNEMDATKQKHKNMDFLKELDKDRREKGCEYAVLVTMLESDNDFYNQGIVDVSHLYPKMYIIRPQFFIPMITLLRNAALNILETKLQLEVLKNQNVDVCSFEQAVDDFKAKFAYNSEQTGKRLLESIDAIDKAISNLQKTRDVIMAAERQMRLASERADTLSIKKLCSDNPTMAAAFAAAHNQ